MVATRGGGVAYPEGFGVPGFDDGADAVGSEFREVLGEMVYVRYAHFSAFFGLF